MSILSLAGRKNPGCASDGNNSHLFLHLFCCSWQKRRGFQIQSSCQQFRFRSPQNSSSQHLRNSQLYIITHQFSYGTGVTKLLGAAYNLISCPRLFSPSIKRASLIISFPLHTFRNCVKLQRLLPVTVCRNNTGNIIINGSTPLWKKKEKENIIKKRRRRDN